MSRRVLTALVGDVTRQADMQTKYGGLFDALAQKVTIVEHYDARLRGLARYWNALQVLDFSRRRWRERFFRNIQAFRTRSEKFVHHLRSLSPKVEVVLQMGAMFDATWDNSPVPVVVYTDNTTAITARHPRTGRYVFSPRELEGWLAHEQTLYRRAAHICVRGSIVKSSLIDDYDIPAEKISVIGGGVNFSPLPGPVKRQANEAPIILFIGQDFYRKGGDLVLQAFAHVRKESPAVKLLVVTRDAIPADLPMDGVTRIQLGWDREAVAALYSQAALLVLPARHETWGDVLIEAMAFELPCIGVTGQAMEDIILDNQTGLLVEPEDPHALARAMLVLLANPELRTNMGIRARELTRQKFNWNSVAATLQSILNVAAESVSS